MEQGTRSPVLEISLDTCSSHQVFKDKSLLKTKYIKEGLHLTGIDSSAGGLTLREVASTICGLLYVNENVAGNILSFGKLKDDGHDVLYQPMKDSFELRWPIASGKGGCVVFERDKSGMYTASVDVVALSMDRSRRVDINLGLARGISAQAWNSSVRTVSSNLTRYSRRDIERGRVARELQKKLAFISSRTLSHMLRRGDLVGCDVKVADVSRADDIWGPHVTIVKGKTTGHQTPELPAEVPTGPRPPR